MKCKICNNEFINSEYKISHINGCCNYKCYRKTEEFKNKQNIGQEKRKKKLIKNGYMSEDIFNVGKKCICINCNSEYIYNRDRKYKIYGFCSKQCLYKSGIVKHKKIITELKNNGYDIDNCNEQQIKDIWHEYSVKHSISGQEKRVKTINSRNGFKHLGKKGVITNRKRFLIRNNIISVEDMNNISVTEIDKLFLENYNKITNIGQKIIDGRIKKYGSLEIFNIHMTKNVNKTKFKNYCLNNNLDIESLTDKQKEEHIKKCNKEASKKSFLSISRIEWKRRCLNGFKNIDKKSILSEEEIESLYSIYMSERTNKLFYENVKNGYKRTKKGWYVFNSTKNKMFFRSSWEELLLQKLDNLLLTKLIDLVKEPEHILYFDSEKNKIRCYYPDVEYSYYNIEKDIQRNIIIEVKPESKICEINNCDKFEHAISKYKDCFFILTEKEIFSNDIENILINL